VVEYATGPVQVSQFHELEPDAVQATQVLPTTTVGPVVAAEGTFPLTQSVQEPGVPPAQVTQSVLALDPVTHNSQVKWAESPPTAAGPLPVTQVKHLLAAEAEQVAQVPSQAVQKAAVPVPFQKAVPHAGQTAS
jgi:hypothetical protein